MFYDIMLLVFTVFFILLSISQGLPRNSGHLTDEKTFEDAILERIQTLRDVDDDDNDDANDSYNQNDLVLLNVLEALGHHKRSAPEDEYELYNDNENSEEDTYGEETESYTDLIAKEYKKELLKTLRQKKELLHKAHKISQKIKKELVQKIKQKKEAKIKVFSKLVDKNVSKKKREYPELGNNDEIASVETHGESEKKEVVSTKNNNEQVATVTLDDSVKQQEDFVRKLDPKDVFYDPVSDNVSSTTTKPPPQVSHVKQVVTNKKNKEGLDRISFIAVIAGCCVAAISGIALATYCWFKLRRETKELHETNQTKPPAIKTLSKKKDSKKGNGKDSSLEDDKLAQSAEVFHYLHAKKQMQQMSEPNKKAVEKYVSDETSDEEDEGDENTVYECPGLAPPGDMKVVNPLFSDTESHHSDHHSDEKLSDSHSNEDSSDKQKTPTPPPPQINQDH